jgi:hypothetical protein
MIILKYANDKTEKIEKKVSILAFLYIFTLILQN